MPFHVFSVSILDFDFLSYHISLYSILPREYFPSFNISPLFSLAQFMKILKLFENSYIFTSQKKLVSPDTIHRNIVVIFSISFIYPYMN